MEIDPTARGIIFSLLGLPGGPKIQKIQKISKIPKNPKIPLTPISICWEYGIWRDSDPDVDFWGFLMYQNFKRRGHQDCRDIAWHGV